MTPARPSERGAADGTALVAALVLGALAFAPTALLRQGRGWKKGTEEALRGGPLPAAPRSPIPDALAAAARASADGPVFRPDPARRLGPPPAAVETASVPPVPSTARVTDLDGKVADGRLAVRWTPAPGSRGTSVRVEGLGGPEPLEREVPAGASALEFPVPGTTGTLVVRATPLGPPSATAPPESRVSIPYRIPVEVVRAERAVEGTGSALLRLRRFYDGKPVEAEFALHESDPVGDLSPAFPGGPIVDFRTDLVLEEVRDLQVPGPFVEVPLFSPEGKVQRDAEGRPLTFGRASTVDAGQEVVLRGPNDERRVVPVR